MKKVVITGGPSIGKTTVIELLAARGYATVPEAARLVIIEERVKDSDLLPGKNLAGFQEVVVQKQLALEAAAEGEIVFLDRSVVDGVAYCRLGNVPVPPEIHTVGKNRYDHIFLLDSLGIYVEDGVRSKDLEDAEQLQLLVEEAYKEFGYAIVRVPVLTPEERVDFILARI